MWYEHKEIKEEDILSATVASKELRRLNAGMFAFFALILSVSVLVYFTFASPVTNRRDIMSNQSTSASSSHAVSFNLSGGNTFAVTEQVAVDFPEASFTGSGTWATTDFAFSDGTARVINAVNAGPGVTTVACVDAVNNVGVAIDTTALVFRAIPCGASFTPSASGAFVTFTIDGEAGGGQLANPASTGSYVINILSAGGDCLGGGDDCRIGVTIVTTGNVGVTATVSGGTCGDSLINVGESCDDGNNTNGDGCSATCQVEGGGGGGPPPDITPPVISNILVTGIGTTTATVTWTTDETSDSTVNYGLTNSYGSQSYDGGFLINHSRGLSGLIEGATYNFQVCSKDNVNNQSCSSNNTFTLLDETPPVISNLQVTAISGTGATVTWDTNENASQFVEYGLVAGPPYANTLGTTLPRVTSHSVVLSGLTPSTTYNYRVRSGDASNNEAITVNATFNTTDGTAPVISGLTVTAITATSATFTWTTNENATRFVDYGLTNAYGTTAGTAIPLQTSHSVVVTGLTAGTTYNYRVRSADAQSNEASTTDATFTTTDTTPPVISAVTVTGLTPSTATITWTTDENADSLVEYGPTVVYGLSASSATLVTGHSIPLSALTPGQTYNFRVTSKDAGNNTTVSSNFQFTTPLPAAPVISNSAVSMITQTSARVSWDTNTLTSSRVDYGTTVAYGANSFSATYVTSHLRNLTGLTKGTTYHYKITSVDQYGQSVVTADGTFATLPDTDAPANVTTLTAAPGDSQIGLSWTNPADLDFQGVMVRRKATGFPTGPTDGTQVYQGSGTSTLDLGLTNGVVYYYAVYAFDDVPNYSSGALTSAIPSGVADTTPPGAVTGFTATPGNQQVILAWTNPTDIDFQGVRIVRKLGSYPANATDGTIVYTGSSTSGADVGLNNGTQYFYAAFAYDAVPNYAVPAQSIATPFAPVDSSAPAPVSGFTAVAGDTLVQLIWSNPSDPDWAGTRVVRKEGSPSTGPNDGTIVFDGVGDSRLDPFVVNGTTYYYTAYAYDTTLNYSTPVNATATPQAGLLPPPGPSCSDSDGGQNYSVQGTVTFSSQTFQDTCVDATTVSENYCDVQIRATVSQSCGTGYRCSAGACVLETLEPVIEQCGNGICAATENSLSCPVDCPIVPPEGEIKPVTPPASRKLELRDMRFHATLAKIPLGLQDDIVTVYRGMAFTMKIPDESIYKPIKSVHVNLNGRTYSMRQTASFEAVVAAQAEISVMPFSVVVEYTDSTSDVVSGKLRTVDRSQVYEVVNGQEVGVANARITLLVNSGGGNYGLWNGTASNQINPSYADAGGVFGYIVPPGTYKIRIDAEGYGVLETLPFSMGADNVVQKRLRIIKLPEKLLDVATFATDTAIEKTKDIINNEFVESGAQDIAAPTAIAAAAANVVAASAATATAIPYLLYLWSLISHPFLLIARRRRKQWGVVYDVLKKLPVDLAIVRLLDAKTGRIIRSAVTDKDGRYFFIVQPGEYRIVAVKVGYVFPSVFLKGIKEDGEFLDLYHGENINVKEETTITANIPMDPTTAEKSPRRVLLEGVGRMLQKGLGVVSIVAMVAVFVITPTVLMGVLLAVNVIMYVVFRRLAVPPKPKNWGIVYDEKTGQPLSNVVARVFETKYNKLLETQVTDTRGRYAFLVGSNVYYVTFEKQGYQKEKKGPIDAVVQKPVTKANQAQLVAVDVRLTPGKKGQVPNDQKRTGTSVDNSPKQPPVAPVVPPAPKPPAPFPPPAPPSPPESIPPKPPEAPKIPWELQMLRAAKPPAKPPATPPPVHIDGLIDPPEIAHPEDKKTP